MAANKNQHYVPRCHLKPFSVSGEGSAIHLIHLPSRRLIKNAPTRGQCSKSYFYGKELSVERKLTQLEALYAKIVDKLAGEITIDEDELFYLRNFAYLQLSRTESMVSTQSKFINEMTEKIFEGHEDQAIYDDREQWEIARDALDMFAKTLGAISDLGVVIGRVADESSLVTSDDPAVHTNRLHIQKKKDNTFGFMQSGTMLMMPLTPKLAMMSYDKDVYIAQGRKGYFIDITEKDVESLNDLQILNCSNSIFLKDETKAEALISRIEDLSDARLPSRQTFSVLIPDKDDENKFVIGSREETLASNKRFIASQHIFPRPATWPRALAFRSGAIGFTDGSMAGLIRRAHLTVRGGGPYRKVKV